MANYLAAIDQGTTSTRCILFDGQARAVHVSQKEHRQIYPGPGLVEHDALEIWRVTQEVVREAMAQSRVHPTDLTAIGITNQRETTVVWERATGRPVHNAIVWQDTRTRGICDELAREGGYDRFRGLSGLPLATYFSGPKVRWILDHVEGARERAQRGELLFGTIDSYLVWWLTGGPHGGRHLTDPTNASRTMLMNLATLEWDDELLAALEVPRAMLPTIVPSAHASAWGSTTSFGPFAHRVRITGVLGDQQAALVGQHCFAPGEAKNTYGTGCFLLLNTGARPVVSSAGLLTTVAYQLSLAGGTTLTHYALEGSVAVAGSLVRWLRDNLGIIATSGEIETLARSVADAGGTCFVPAFSGLFAPYWRSDARGIVAGLSGHTTKAHLARAALESTAQQTADVLEAMVKDVGHGLKSLRVDGGMSVNELLMQFQADLLGIAVSRPAFAETTALGAALAAGLGARVWETVADLPAVGDWKTWTPTMEPAARAAHRAAWAKAVERSLGWV